MRPLSLSRVPRPLALFVAATLTAASLAACGGGDEEPQAQQADPSEPFTPAEASEEEVTPDTWPLTGLEVADGESAALKHPILVTKIDNSTSSSPQVGLSQADLVVEELVEGGITRLAVFFYSQVPANAGPVRSMRASDIGIVPDDHASVVTSGAAGVTIRRITDAGIPFVQEGGPGTYRDTSRSAPYNLFAHLDETAKSFKQPAVRPADYLPWGDGSDLPPGQEGHDARGSLLGRARHRVAVRRRALRQRQLQRRSRRPVPGRQRADAAGAGGRRGLPRPGRQPGSRDPVRRRGSGLAVPRWPGDPGDLAQGQADLGPQPRVQGQALAVPAGHVWVELVPGAPGNVTWQK